MRFGVTIFMGFVILFAFLDSELTTTARSLLLVFAGVGLTSAGVHFNGNPVPRMPWYLLE